MNSIEFANALKKIANEYNTIYMFGCYGQLVEEKNVEFKSEQYPYWYTEERKQKFKELYGKDYYGFDCVCLIKSVLWGFLDGNIEKGANGVPDINADEMCRRSRHISTDFSDIQIGEIVWLSEHIGVYVGNNEVVECTPKWNDGVQISNLKDRKWVLHAKLPYIDYI